MNRDTETLAQYVIVAILITCLIAIAGTATAWVVLHIIQDMPLIWT